MSFDIATWRAARRESLTLPICGLTVSCQRVNLLDLAAQGRIPTPLLGLAASLMEQDHVEAPDLGAFARHAELVDVVVRACVVEPPLADEPSEIAVGVHEIPYLDKQQIYNWAMGGVAPLARFSGQTGPGA